MILKPHLKVTPNALKFMSAVNRARSRKPFNFNLLDYKV